MAKKPRSMQKKGVIGISFKELIYGVVTFAIIALTVTFTFRWMSMWMGSSGEGTTTSYEELTKRINQELTADGNKFDQAIYIQDDSALIGFDKGAPANTVTKGNTPKNIDIPKPARCGTDACICLCDREGLDKDDGSCASQYAKCTTFNGIDKIIAVDVKYCQAQQRNPVEWYHDDKGTYQAKYMVFIGDTFWQFSGGFAKAAKPLTVKRVGRDIVIADYDTNGRDLHQGKPQKTDMCQSCSGLSKSNCDWCQKRQNACIWANNRCSDF